MSQIVNGSCWSTTLFPCTYKGSETAYVNLSLLKLHGLASKINTITEKLSIKDQTFWPHGCTHNPGVRIWSDPTLSLLLLPALVRAESHEWFGVTVVSPVQYNHLAVLCHHLSYLEGQIIGLWAIRIIIILENIVYAYSKCIGLRV